VVDIASHVGRVQLAAEVAPPIAVVDAPGRFLQGVRRPRLFVVPALQSQVRHGGCLRGVSFTPFWAEAAIRLSRVTVGVTRRARTINVLKQHV